MNVAQELAQRFHGLRKREGPNLLGFNTCVTFQHEGMDIETYISSSRIELRIKNFDSRQQLLFSVNKRKTGMGAFSLVGHPFKKYHASVFSNGLANDAVIRFCRVPQNEEDILMLGLDKSEYVLFSANEIWLGIKQSEIEIVEKRLSILGRLFNRNRKHNLSKSFSADAFAILLQNSRSENCPHFFGGQLMSMPICCNCNTALHLLVTIDLIDSALAFPSIGTPIFRVVTCLNCDAVTSPLFLSFANGNLRVLEQRSGQSFGDFPRYFKELDIKLAQILSQTHEQQDTPRHRLGGSPEWIHGPEVPLCVECGKAMSFIAQVDTDDSAGIQFGDDGMLYVFICEQCEILASFAQSH